MDKANSLRMRRRRLGNAISEGIRICEFEDGLSNDYAIIRLDCLLVEFLACLKCAARWWALDAIKGKWNCDVS